MPIGKKAPEATPASAAKPTIPAKSTGAPPKVAGSKAPTAPTTGSKPAASTTPPASTAPKSSAPPEGWAENDFYKAGIIFFTTATKMMLDGKLHLPVVQNKTDAKPSAEPSASKPVAKGATAPAIAPKSAPAAKSSEPATSAAKSTTPTSSAGSSGERPSNEEIAAMNRAQLLNLCKTLGVPFDDYNGKKREDLAALAQSFVGKGEEEPAGEETEEEGLDEETQRKADAVSDLLGEKYAEYEAYIKPGVPKEEQPKGYLGCGGECQKCPNPDAFPTVKEQIEACYANLGLE